MWNWRSPWQGRLGKNSTSLGLRQLGKLWSEGGKSPTLMTIRKILMKKCHCQTAEVVQDPDPQLPIQGRRIIYVKCLAKGLSACVDPECGKPLSLSDTEEERQYGLASVLFVRCRAFQLLNKIHTDTHMERKEGQRGPTPYTSNVKAAAGEWYSQAILSTWWPKINCFSQMIPAVIVYFVW